MYTSQIERICSFAWQVFSLVKRMLIFMNIEVRWYLHETLRISLLLTDGATPLVAMHRYAPMSDRLTFVKFKSLPSNVFSEIEINRNVEYCYELIFAVR